MHGPEPFITVPYASCVSKVKDWSTDRWKSRWNKRKNCLRMKESVGRTSSRLTIRLLTLRAGCQTVSNNGLGSGLAPAQNILAVQVGLGSLEHHFEVRFGSGSLKKNILVQVRFGFIDLKFNCRYSFRPEKKEKLLILLKLDRL